MGYALADSSSTIEDPSILPANTTNTAADQLAGGPNAAIYASTVRTIAGLPSDSAEVKESKPKASFWQWLSGRTVDCSSGACAFK
jgi:hypothetical protein